LPRLIGFINIHGSQTATANVVLPFRPQKVVIEANHELLAVEKQ
jgi:hypothetical protein